MIIMAITHCRNRRREGNKKSAAGAALLQGLFNLLTRLRAAVRT